MNEDIYLEWKDWDESTFANFSKLERAYFDNISKLVHISNGANILEVGFGNGSFLGYAHRMGYSCDGVESNIKLVENAKNNNYSVFSSIDQIDSKKKYDLIVLFDVIEHIEAAEAEIFLNQLKDKLVEDGSLFLRFPNGSSPLGLGNQHGDPTHCNIVTLSKLHFWCKNLGLEVVKYRGDIRPFIFRHKIKKAPSRIIKLILFKLTEKFIRLISNQSKGILASNLEVVIKIK
ncbi:class I SAM-dependent methyltransferase [Pseudothioglobus sp. nBUS_23]|uniref:class I SAM-dependent methyltransferase n=1 Tax=Pseudothioglobus sp. nBUS_23 TaxID=3395318 RepID=UPI003EB77C22